MFFQFETLFPQVRVYFRLEGLHVEIFSARDVIPLDPNGDCQVSSPYLIFVFFIQPQFETKKFYTWKCINLRQKFSRNKTVRLCVEQFFRVHIGQFYNWLNYFTQPAVMMAKTNMSCSHHSLPLKAQKHRENCKSQCQCLLMLMS